MMPPLPREISPLRSAAAKLRRLHDEVVGMNYQVCQTEGDRDCYCDVCCLDTLADDLQTLVDKVEDWLA